MPTPYSYDLRGKVLQSIDEGMSKTEASKVFKLSRNTINLWLKRREETGNYQAKEGYQKGYNSKITDLEKFKEFAREQGRRTQVEMAQAWGADISACTIGKGLKKIGFTRKKNLWLSGKKRGKKTTISAISTDLQAREPSLCG